MLLSRISKLIVPAVIHCFSLVSFGCVMWNYQPGDSVFKGVIEKTKILLAIYVLQMQELAD